MKCSCGACWIFVLVISLCLSVGEIVFGVLKLDFCATEPSLPVWAIVFGSSAALLVLIVTAYLLGCYETNCCRCRRRRSSSSSSSFRRRSSCVLCLVCLFGFVGVIWLLYWTGLWISGVYFVVTAANEMVVYDQGVQQSQVLDCDLSLVIYCGVCLAWDVIFTVVGCVLLIRHVIRTSQVILYECIERGKPYRVRLKHNTLPMLLKLSPS